MPLPSAAVLGAGLARAGMWAGSATVGYYGITTSFSPKKQDPAPYRY